MAENSKIEWCHHTFNPWRGCRALSEACANCYAKVLVEGRLQQDFSIRTRAAESTWKQPLAWNRKAAKEGRRMRVFCASLADVFDAEVPDSWRDDLFALIASTPHLDWLLLTKRPAVALKYLTSNTAEARISRIASTTLVRPFPWPNVWLGTTVEDRAAWRARGDLLKDTPAAVHFLSMEPLLEDVGEMDLRGIDWVIAGGESGPNARPTHPDWFRSIRDQCAATGVPFLFKQWGEWAPGECAQHTITRTERTAQLINDEWAFGSLTPQASRELHRDDEPDLYRLGKARASRWLDGDLHDGYPVVG